MTEEASDSGRRAQGFAHRVKIAEVVSALRESGVEAVLLKGPAFAELFYSGADRHPPGDIDLLIAPDRRDAAGHVLRALGYELSLTPEDDPLGHAHAEVWGRQFDSSGVDLHLTLPETRCPPALSWRLLGDHVIALDLGGSSVPALDGPASALLAALHAAHHGLTGTHTGEDLRRALGQVDLAGWREAAGLAESLGAQDAFGEGLAAVAEGDELARRLGVHTTPSVRRRLLWTGSPWGAVVLDELARSSPGRRPLVIARLLVPTPGAMRAASSLARRGRTGLALAYIARPLSLALKLPAAVRALAEARREAARRASG